MGFGDAHPPGRPRRGAEGGRDAATSPSDRPLPGDGAATRWRTTERGKEQVRGAAGARPSPPAATPGRAEELRTGWVSLPLGPRPQREADSAAACRAPGRGGEAPSPAPAGFPAPPLRPPAPPPPRPSSEAEPRFLRGLGPRLLRRRPGHNGVLVHGLRDAASRPSARLSWPQAPRRQPLRPWAPGAAWVRTDLAARVRGAPPRPRRNPARSAWRSRPPFCLRSGDVGGRPRGHRRSVAQASKCWCAPRVVACLKQTS